MQFLQLKYAETRTARRIALSQMSSVSHPSLFSSATTIQAQETEIPLGREHKRFMLLEKNLAGVGIITSPSLKTHCAHLKTSSILL